MVEFRVDKRLIGPGNPVYIIAEVGSNHDGSLEQAKKLIDASAEAGANAVKFQSFTAEGLAARSQERLYNFFKTVEMPKEWHRELADYAKGVGVDFLSSPFDEDAVDLLYDVDVPAFKIASGDLTHYPLLRRAARYGRPIILSTGMGTLGEVEQAVECLRAGGTDAIALLHCVSNYPPQFEDANIRAMVTMREAFGLPVGYSDHSPGLVVPLGAVALGACIIEKHITFDRSLKGPDHPYALEVAEFAQMVRDIRNLEAALGSGVKEPVEGEVAERMWARRGLYAARPIPKGTVLAREMIKLVRPCLALGPDSLELVQGRVAREDIGQDEAIT
ncbi:MAG: AFP-like protein, partial [Dehalococcoidia bacterium]|nr:AFP-like protein [Dehalococcoidia bacterium]